MFEIEALAADKEQGGGQSRTDAVIFDFDGLIMDTETATYEAWRQIYAGNGQALTVETWAQCVGSDHGDSQPVAKFGL